MRYLLCGFTALFLALFVVPIPLWAGGNADSIDRDIDPSRVGQDSDPIALAKAILAKEKASAEAMGRLRDLAIVEEAPRGASSPNSGPGTSPAVRNLVAGTPKPSSTLAPSPSISPSPVTIRIPLENFGPRTFNPAFAQDPASKLIRHLTQASLVRRSDDSKNDYVPVLAESWQMNAGGTEFTISLKPGLKWSDGSPLTAADWVDAAASVYDNPQADSIRIGSTFIWTASDDRHIELTSASPRNLADFLASCERFPLSTMRYATWRQLGSPGSLGTGRRADSEASRFLFFDSKVSDLIASGPWKISEYVIGKSLRLSPNEFFAGGSTIASPWPSGIAIDFIFVRDNTEGFASVARAEAESYAAPVDLVWSQVSNGGSASGMPFGGRLLLSDPGTLCLSIAFNTQKGAVFETLANRVLVGTAIDREELARVTLEQRAFPAYGLWANEVAAGQNPHPSSLADLVELQKFRDSLPKSRPISNTKFESFTLMYEAQNPSREIVAHFVAQKLATKGIKVALLPLAFDDMVARMSFGGDWEAALVQIDDSRSPQNLALFWPELMSKGATLTDVFFTIFRQSLAVPLVRFRNLVAIRQGSPLDSATAAWLVNRFQVAKQEFM